MPRGRHRASFDHVSEFDRGRIAAYSSQKSVTQRIGRNQATVMWIYNRWMWIVRLEVMSRVASLRTIAQQIQSVTHHSVSNRTIRRRLHQNVMSVRHSLPRLPFTGNHRCLRANGVIKGRHVQRNRTTLCLMKNPASACNITMVGFEFEDTEQPRASSQSRLIRYGIVLGIKDSGLQEQLFHENKLVSEKAIGIVKAAEASWEQIRNMKYETTTTNFVKRKENKNQPKKSQYSMIVKS
ncbi:HTH_38 domain-containing protein [Trichonephila clavipes]|nr:HTH_38 domain-containing protein [Trichonephila clavipes]